MGQIGLDQHVERLPLARFPDERDAKLTDDLATGAITTKEEAGLDLVGLVRQVIPNRADDDVSFVRGPRKGEEGCVEA
jgi:hypothetical protein